MNPATYRLAQLVASGQVKSPNMPMAQARRVLATVPGGAHSAVLRRPAVGDFVNGGYPLPVSPIYDGIGDFVNGGFPLPQNPVYFPSSAGSLPKAPDLTMRDLAPLPAADSPCGGKGVGCGCSDCGMGDTTTTPFYEPYLDNAEAWFQGSTTLGGASISNMYLVAGAVALYFFMQQRSSTGSRRRR